MKKEIDLDIDFIKEIIKMKDSPIPSLNTYRYWISYILKNNKDFKSTDSTGKWCIFSTVKNVDKDWIAVKSLIDSGMIIGAKVSTAFSMKNTEYKKYVICVYTKDWNDMEDLNKTREALYSAGFNKKLKYKRDIDTHNKVQGKKEFYISI